MPALALGGHVAVPWWDSLKQHNLQSAALGCYVDIGGHSLHYIDAGPCADEPVLMLHGNPTWSYHFRHLIAALVDRHRCLAPDHIGMGLSARPRARDYPFTLQQRVADLDELIGKLGISGRISLVMHDWGGMIGFAWASRNPERVARLVVMNTAAFPMPEQCHLPWQLQLCRLPLLGTFLVRGLNIFSRAALVRCASRHRFSAAERRAYLAPYAGWRRALAVHRFIADIPLCADDPCWDMVCRTMRLLPALRHCPLLICWGMRDFVFDVHYLGEWQKHFPDARVECFADAGHYLLEDEAQAVPRLIAEFLNES